MDYFLFAATAAGMTWSSAKASKDTCDASELLNSAFVFVKPHANTPSVQKLVRAKLQEKGISILSESDISGEVIDKTKLIDQHYYAIGEWKGQILLFPRIPGF